MQPFNDSKYTLWYHEIVESARDRLLEGYGETHHVLPRSKLKRGKFGWYTNGVENKKVRLEGKIPEGFYRGRTLGINNG